MNVRAAPDEDVLAFGVRLAEQRRLCGLLQDDVARKIGCSQRAVSLWEAGDRVPSCYWLAELAELYGVSMDALWRGGG